MSNQIKRRWFLRDGGVALGGIAMHGLLGGQAHATDQRKPHFATRAKRVVYLFMGGAPSHLELFDNKPALAKYDGTLPPPALLQGYRAAFINPNNKLLGPRYKFAQHGRSGAELSELLPHLATVVDDIAIVRSMKTDAFNHAPAQVLMNTGSQQFGRPSLGAWSVYGLGALNQNLPAYVALTSAAKGPSGGPANFGCGFLPTVYQGVPFRGGGDPVLYLSNPPGVDAEAQRDSLNVLRELNEAKLASTGDPEIATRINAFELAFRMQASAPEAIDLSAESSETLALYGAEPGKSSFANNCLLARRLLERGVRFVQLHHEAWDHHGNLVRGLKEQCEATDRACTALVKDLKRRGLLDDTLVIWGGEFGRTPMVQGGTADGRDHHPNAFTMWLAGGGVRPGITLGETDDLGFNVTKDEVHVHDLHATILHLLGFDHTRLTFRSQGRDFRLTDVHGTVVKKLIS